MRTAEAIKQEILSIISGALDGNPVIDANRDLPSQGLHSILVITVIVKLEEHFSITFEDDEMDIGNFATVGHLCEAVIGKLSD